MFNKKYEYRKFKKLLEQFNLELLHTEEEYNKIYKNTFSKVKVKCKLCGKIQGRKIVNILERIRAGGACQCQRKKTFKDFLSLFIQKNLNKYFWIK